MERISCDAKTIAFVKSAVETADLVGMESMMFRPGLVSGATGKSGLSVILLHEHTNELSFDVLGVMNARDLKSRLALTGSSDGAIEADSVQEKIDQDPTARTVVTKLFMKNGRMKLTYAAGSPKALKAPRRLTFTENCSLPLNTGSTVQTLSNARGALITDADTLVTLSAAKGELVATVVDKNNDVFEDVLCTLGGSAAFSHRYYLNYFLPLVKAHAENVPIVVSKEGILKFVINGFAVYQLPKV